MRVQHPSRTKPIGHTFLKGMGAALLGGVLTVAMAVWGIGAVPAGAGIGFTMFLIGYWLGYGDGEQMGNMNDSRGDSQSE